MKIVGCSPNSLRLLLVLLSLPLAAQDAEGLQPRQLYYKSKSGPDVEQKNPKSTSAATNHPQPHKSNPLGLKYAIEQQQSSGKYIQVDPDKTFSTGDAIRLRIEVNSDAFVYLLSRGASGDGSFLFPQPGENNRLKAYQSVQVPGEPADPIAFAEPAGTELLVILVSRTPVADLDKYLPKRASSQKLVASNIPSGSFGAFVNRAEQLQGRDLVRGKVSQETNDVAVYAVNVSTAPGSQVLQKLELKHR